MPDLYRGALAASAVVALLAATGCVSVSGPEGVERHDSESVAPGGAQSVSVELNMGAGELEVRGGAQSLMDASFRYRSFARKPEVKYNVVGGHGRLIVRNSQETETGHGASTWDLRLNPDIPLDLAVRIGAGSSNLALGSVQLRNLSVEMGAGELKLDLTGHPKRDVDVRVRGGVGEATLRLPASAAVEVSARGGIGGINVRGLEKRGDKYVNPAYDTAKVAMHVDVQGGIGGINLICE